MCTHTYCPGLFIGLLDRINHIYLFSCLIDRGRLGTL